MQSVFNHFAGRHEAAHGIRKGWTKWLEQDTLLCRCEETKYGSFCDTISKTESSGLRSAKLTTRAGLGICQGRICGRNVEAILTQLTGDSSGDGARTDRRDRKSTRLNSSHVAISYAVFCLKKKTVGT